MNIHSCYHAPIIRLVFSTTCPEKASDGIASLKKSERRRRREGGVEGEGRRGGAVNRKRLKELAKNERFIPGIYNYCDRWCERCPQTGRCLNFSISQEEFSDPETRDLRNEAFWRELSEIFKETLELLEEEGKKWGIELKNLDSAPEDETVAENEKAARDHVLSRTAGSYATVVDEWFKEREQLFFFPTGAAGDESIKIEDALEVIRWYQYFIAAKVMRAVRGSMEGPGDDCDGSAKIAMIGIDRSIGAWGVIPRHNRFYQESVWEMISLLKLLKQAIQETFSGAESFVRPGLDEEKPK